MTDRPLLFAFLADRLASARQDITIGYRDVVFTRDRTGTIKLDGVETPFRIVTEPEQLRGLDLCGWTFVPSADGLPYRQKRDLWETAQTRLRK